MGEEEREGLIDFRWLDTLQAPSTQRPLQEFCRAPGRRGGGLVPVDWIRRQTFVRKSRSRRRSMDGLLSVGSLKGQNLDRCVAAESGQRAEKRAKGRERPEARAGEG